MATLTAELPGLQGNIDRPRPFIPTPERVSQYLELKAEEVSAQMKSVNGRQELFAKLMEHEADLRRDHADFNPESLRMQMDATGEALQAESTYLKDVKSPEKKGLFKRAWESIKGFPRKHPIVTTVLAAALVAGGLYYAWGYLGSIINIPNVAEGAGAVANEIIAPTGGAFEAVPQSGIALPSTIPAPSGLAPELAPVLPPTGTTLDLFPPNSL